MPSIGQTTRPGYVYDSATDTWIPIGIGPHTHASTDLSGVIANSIVDAKADLITATADNTPARLAVGANGTVLTANSSTATGLEWTTPAAGGFTLLSTTTLTGSNSFSFTGISSSYTHLLLVVNGLAAATNGAQMRIDTSASTDMVANTIKGINTTASAQDWNTDTTITLTDPIGTSGAQTQNRGTGFIWFYGYNNNPIAWNAHFVVNKDGPSHYNTAGTFLNTWNGFVLSMSSGNFDGGTARLYGVK